MTTSGQLVRSIRRKAWILVRDRCSVLRGAFLDFYVRNFLSNETAANISWIGSVQLCLQSCMGMLAGAAFDRGYFHHVVALGSVIYVLCMFLLSLAKPHQYYQARYLPRPT